MENKIKITQIKSCVVDEKVTVDVYIKELKEIDTTGRNYSQTMVIVEDRTGSAKFPIWKTKDSVQNEIMEGNLYTLNANITLHNGEKQLKYIAAKLIEDNPQNRKRIDPYYSLGITEENEKALLSVIETKFESERYKRYAEVALGLGEVPKNDDGTLKVSEKEYRNRLEVFKKAWCSINHHDNYSGGLWNHVVGIMRVLLVVKKIYAKPIGRQEERSEINWDHLLLMSVLHDIEKPTEYLIDEDTNKCYYNTEIHTNHRINGVSRVAMIHAEVERKYQLTFNELEKIKYGILCHHGQWGEYEFKTSEDKIFASLDLIDAANVEALRLE